MEKLIDAQIGFARNAVAKWLAIYQENKCGLRHHGSEANTPTPADADHSALLARLLSGKEPLDKPPPLRYSYPSYELGEGNEVEVWEVHTLGPTKYVIDQHTGWTLELDGSVLNALITLHGPIPMGVVVLRHDNGDHYILYRKSDKQYLRKVAHG